MTDKELQQNALNAIKSLRRGGKLIAYVSGKVTGLSPKEVKAKFGAKQRELEDQGFAVFNPVEWIKPNCSWNMAMKLCVVILPICDAIYLLDDWQESKGAKEEHRLAELLEIAICR